MVEEQHNKNTFHTVEEKQNDGRNSREIAEQPDDDEIFYEIEKEDDGELAWEKREYIKLTPDPFYQRLVEQSIK